MKIQSTSFKKRILSLMFIIALLTCFAFNVSAESVDNSSLSESICIDGAIAPVPGEYEKSLTKADLQKLTEKTALAEEFAAQNPPTKAATKISIPGSFTMYQQTNGYYCVPASVRSVIYYNSGTLISQGTIASALGTTTSGTDFGKVPNYVNSKQNFFYAMHSSPTQSSIFTRLQSTVAGSKKPTMMRISNPSGSNWHYATNGHALINNAVYSDNSRAQFADPLGGTQSGWAYFYEKTAAVTANVCTHLIW